MNQSTSTVKRNQSSADRSAVESFFGVCVGGGGGERVGVTLRKVHSAAILLEHVFVFFKKKIIKYSCLSLNLQIRYHVLLS